MGKLKSASVEAPEASQSNPDDAGQTAVDVHPSINETDASSLANMDESTAVAVRRPNNPPKPPGARREPSEVERSSISQPNRTASSGSEPNHPTPSGSQPNRAAAGTSDAEGSSPEPGRPIFIPGALKRDEAPASKSRPRLPSLDVVAHGARHRVLIAMPFATSLLLAVALAMSGPNPEGLYRVEVAVAQALGFWGCLAAALIFESGDYLRRAWLLETICYALIFIGDLTLTTGVFSHRPWAPLANGVLTLAANASFVGGTFLLARAMRVAGIELPGSAWTRRTVQLLALAVAGLAAGPAALFNVRQILAGNQSALMSLASCLGDMFCFALIAPLALTTVAMRGGLLAWTYGFMTVSGLAWLTYDAVSTLSPILFGVSVDHARPILEIARCVACTSAFSAGLAQRWTIIDTAG